MSGHVLTFEARDIHERALEEGRREGFADGREEERRQIIARMLQNGFPKEQTRAVIPDLREDELERVEEAVSEAGTR